MLKLLDRGVESEHEAFDDDLLVLDFVEHLSRHSGDLVLHIRHDLLQYRDTLMSLCGELLEKLLNIASLTSREDLELFEESRESLFMEQQEIGPLIDSSLESGQFRSNG